MGPALTAAELAARYPHLTPAQRVELEQWHRGRMHAWMEGRQPEAPAEPPWPEAPRVHPGLEGATLGSR
jgi:hypothetical protein